MDYKLFRFEATVDFVEIEIRTASPTQGKAIKRKCSIFGVSYARRQGTKGSFSGSTFRIRLYDVKTFAALQSKIASIESEFPFALPPIVTMIEVAFDAYLKDGSNNATDDDLAMLAARMAYFVAYPVSKNRRTYLGYKGSPQALPRTVHALAREMLGQGRNVGIGNKRDAWYQHCYLKTVDRSEQLPQRDHRARFEIRLAGAALPYQDIEAWRAFKFETLARWHLNWRREDDTATPYQQAINAGYADRASHPKDIKRRDGGGTVKRTLYADTDLNTFARVSLRSLSARWS